MAVFTKTQLIELGTTQVERLRALGAPTNALVGCEILLNHIEEGVRVRNGNHPFLMVVPFSSWGFEEQMKAVRYSPAWSGREPQPAYTFLKLDTTISTFTSRQPYALLDVENGIGTLGLSPMHARAKVGLADRRAFGVEQCVALAIHFPETFDSHNIHASDSEMSAGGTSFTPDFWVYGGKIKMKRDSLFDGDPKWGTPSYGEVII